MHEQLAAPLEQIRRAVWKDDAAGLRALLEGDAAARAAVDATVFAFGSTAVAHAAGAGKLDVLRVLLEHGADPNRRSDWWAGPFHPLHGATPEAADVLLAHGAIADACAAAHLDQAELLRALLDEEPARVHERGGDGQTPLHFARSTAVADLLLERGADIDARDVDHRASPAEWMLAGRRGAGRYALAEHLVDRGATADIFLAAALGRLARLRALLDDDPAALDLRTGRGAYAEKPPSSFHIYTWTIGQNLTPLQVATRFEQQEAEALLLASASPAQRFVHACATANAAAARAQLADDPSLPASLDADDARAIADAAWNGDAPAVALMLEVGFDPAAGGQDGGSALHCAAWEGMADIVRDVLRYPAGRALVGVRDPTHGSTPLGWCCHGAVHCGNPRGDYPAVARALLEAGADAAPYAADAPGSLRSLFEEWRGR